MIFLFVVAILICRLKIINANSTYLLLNLESFNIRVGKLFIKITNNENNLENIEEIILKLIPKYNLNNFKILDKMDNCYFLERLS